MSRRRPILRGIVAWLAVAAPLSCGSEGSPGTRCPTALPTAGGPCSSNLFCEYPGSDPQHVCRPQANCSLDQTGNPSWHVTLPAPGCGTHPSPCPATFTILAEGAACPVASGPLSCDYDEGRCGCILCSTVGGGRIDSVWSCRAWASGDTGCPPIAPLAGSACSTPDTFCFYSPCGGISVGQNLQCSNGTWQQRGSGGTCGMTFCSAT
jgi:hypothetical protein